MSLLPFVPTRTQPSPMFQATADMVRRYGARYPKVQWGLVRLMVAEGALSEAEALDLLAMLPTPRGAQQ